MQLETTRLHIGLEKPIRVLHMTDNHFALADERDNERKRQLAQDRTRAFNKAEGDVERFTAEMIAYAEAHCDLILHTGDLMDFVSEANIDCAAEIVKNEKMLFIAGNHEYSQYVGEAWEDHAYRMNSYMHIQPRLGIDLMFASRIVGGVNFVAVDNGYYQFTEWQRRRLEMELCKGLPVVLAMHDPIFEQALYDVALPEGVTSAYLVGCDEEHLLPYQEYRALQQRPTEETMKFIEFIKGQPLIRAVVAGHMHYPFVSELWPGCVQVVTGAAYRNMAREIIID